MSTTDTDQQAASVNLADKKTCCLHPVLSYDTRQQQQRILFRYI